MNRYWVINGNINLILLSHNLVPSDFDDITFLTQNISYWNTIASIAPKSTFSLIIISPFVSVSCSPHENIFQFDVHQHSPRNPIQNHHLSIDIFLSCIVPTYISFFHLLPRTIHLKSTQMNLSVVFHDRYWCIYCCYCYYYCCLYYCYLFGLLILMKFAAYLPFPSVVISTTNFFVFVSEFKLSLLLSLSFYFTLELHSDKFTFEIAIFIEW